MNHAMHGVAAGPGHRSSGDCTDSKCLQCILKDTKAFSDKRNDQLREYWEQMATGDHLEAAVLGFSLLTCCMQHEDLCEMKVGCSREGLCATLVITGFIPSAASLLKKLIDLEGEEQEHCTAYYIVSIFAEFLNLKNKELNDDPLQYDMFPHKSWELHEGFIAHGQIVESGIIKLFVELVQGNKGVFECIKAANALRAMVVSRELLQEIFANSAIEICYECYTNFPEQIKSFGEGDFKAYELMLSCIGIGSQQSYSFPEMTRELALERLYTRVPGVLENTIEVIANCGLLPEVGINDFKFNGIDIIRFSMNLSMVPYRKESDEDQMISIFRLWGHFCRRDDDKNAKILIEDYSILDHFEKFVICSPPSYVTRTFIIALMGMIEAAGSGLKTQVAQAIGEHFKLMDFLVNFCTAVHDFYGLPAVTVFNTLLVSGGLSTAWVQQRTRQLKSLMDALVSAGTPSFIVQFTAMQLKEKHSLDHSPKQPRHDVRSARQAKQTGNQLFKKQKYAEAKAEYLKGLQCMKLVHGEEEIEIDLNNNVAMCCLKLGEYEEVIQHTNATLFCAENKSKPLYRRACALEEMGDDYMPAAAQCWSKLCLENQDPTFLQRRTKIVARLRHKRPELFQHFWML